MFFDNWSGLGRVLAVGIPAYFMLVFLLVASGKRTLSKMNAFDLVVTVAIGSTLSTVLLSKQVALAEGVLALALLIFLQLVISWLSVRSERVRRSVKAEPALLYHDGCFIAAAMKRERVTEDEVRQAVRGQGQASMAAVAAVVLETDGSLSVLGPPTRGEASALADVHRG
ncbi:DUF421 domain-containing protein [Alkalilimnicola sp. S0819]|uniref:DUF421 domain-containing protein n=1 Tax=Alkalilimnicola sp. S0819 TaxID=2613922 RepID=UPI001262A9E5|nr:YetF domain-containing protein [Alkalilimnicola sp. S0819]KAB7624125.1 DUF421 domain-containing protein [Alkalilimnicola sp. S0819]MPQ16377.1 DUF421 domain-containing protein [Alkalilimnicola sp. S0819]